VRYSPLPLAGEGPGVRACVLAALLCLSPAHAEPPLPYEVVTETDMPHLEENLRYAVRREQRCLDRHDLSAAFWMLGHVALKDCRLIKTGEGAASAEYRLECSGGHGTTGGASWQFDPQRWTGTLRVRLGGKNMTFYQRITATPARDALVCG
jgi:hypothetical protein